MFGLHATGWHAFAITRDLEPGIGIRASMSGAGVHARVAFGSGPVSVPLSVGIEAGALVGGGAGTRVRSTQSVSPWATAVAGAGIAWPARSRLALRLSADALVALVRPGIHLVRDGVDREAFRAPPVGARVLVGPELHFW